MKKHYFDITNIEGRSGEVVEVVMEFPTPPLNKNLSVGVFKSKNDFCTTVEKVN